jgi:hypothetical protein
LTARSLITGAQFRRDVKLARRRGKDLTKLRDSSCCWPKAAPFRPATKTMPLPESGSTTVTVTWNQIGC